MNQIIMILLVSLLVLVHEFGHYIAAKLCGVRVSRFGIGMPLGPSWKMFTFKKTEFYLHAFLFGGYVAFPDDLKEDEDSDDIDEIPMDSPERYENKTIAQKLFIVSAGVIMNVVFAIFLVIACAMYYHKLPTSTQNIYVDSFSSKITSNIQSLGLKKDDKIYKINGTPIIAYYQMNFYSKASRTFDDYAQKSLYEKNLAELKRLNPSIGETIKEGVTVKLPKTLAEDPLSVNKNVMVGLEKYKKDGIELNKNQIELRNEVYSKKTYKTTSEISLDDLALALSDTYKPLEVIVIRDGKEITLKNVKVEKEGLMGVLLKVEDIYAETKTPKDIVLKSCDYLYTTTATMLFSLWQLFSGKVNASDMHGVIAVVKVGGDIIASKGMLNGILLTAMISINLAIMNFLPIPALDGGHVAFLIFEKLTGKKPTPEVSEKINTFFFALLIALMVAICYNDIFALITKKF